MSKLLILIDMQNGFNCPEVIKVIESFNKNSSRFENVCFAMFENKKQSLFETQLKWHDFQTEKDKALLQGLIVPEGAHYIWHSTYTVYNEELKEYIRTIKPKDIYIAGLFSDVCLLKTSMDMFDNDIVPYVVTDLSTSPHGDSAHQIAFSTMKMAIGEDRIISVKDIE